MAFYLQDFIHPSAKVLQVREKTCYKDYLNLSSNELHHVKINELTKSFFENNLANISRCYPYAVDIKREMATYFQLNTDQILLTAGSDFTINLLLLYLGYQKSVILLNPEYYSYKNYTLLNGMDLQLIDSLFEYKQLLKTQPSSIAVLSNPNGITGQKLELDEIQILAEICLSQNHILLIDEAYSNFCSLDHTHLLNKYHNIIILKTFSKSHGMAGHRFSVVFGHNQIVNYLQKTGIENTVSSISLHYFQFLLKNDLIIQEIICDINRVKEKLSEFLSRRFESWHVYNTATNFLTIDTKNENVAKEVTHFFYTHNIIIKHLDSMCDLKTCIRITVPDVTIMDHLIHLFMKFGDSLCK